MEYARFADDLVVLVDAHPRHAWLKKAVPTRLRQELAKLQVEVNEEKSTTVELARGESFGFLGFDFRRIRCSSGAWRPQYTPKLKKRTALLQQAQGHLPTLPIPTGRSGDRTDQPDSAGLGELLRGGHSSRCFTYIRDWVERRSGATFGEPRNAMASAGRGGVGNGWTRRWGCSTATGSAQSSPKALPA